MSPIDLGDYVDVKARIALFYQQYPEGRLVTESISMSMDPDGIVRVWARALAYRSPEDTLPGTGCSYLKLPQTSPYTNGSEAENAETSAWGRAIGCLGIGIAGGIASAEEIRNKAQPAEVERDPTGGLIGTVAMRKPPADLELRQTPDGFAYGFGLVGQGDRGRVQVMAVGPLAEALHAAGLKVGERVTVYGSVEFIPWQKTENGRKKDMPPYQRLTLARIVTSEYTLPGPEPVDSDLSDLPDDLPLPLGAPA